MINPAGISVFSLTGFNATVNYRVALFSLSLISYCTILFVNLTLVLVIALDRNLHEPMYICLCNLCINSIYGTTGFYPKFVSDLLSDVRLISYSGCIMQVFVIYSSVKVDYSTLALMAYDRYVAICLPLKYHVLMSLRRTAILVCLAWLVPCSTDVLVLSISSRLRLCGTRIDKLYCENWAIVKLACGSTRTNDIVGLFIISMYIGHYVFILISYIPLVRSALRSRESLGKFTQTCIPHIMCLINVTGALLFDVMYARYGSLSLEQNVRNFMAIQFLLIPPLLNPIIYGVILTKVRRRLISLCLIAGQRLKVSTKGR